MGSDSIAMFQNGAYIVIALLVVGTLYTLISPLLEGDQLKKRMNSVADSREGMRQARLNKLNAKKGLRNDTKGGAKSIVEKFSLEKLLEASNLKDKLSQAGLRGDRPVYMFYMFRFIMPIAALVIGVPIFYTFKCHGSKLDLEPDGYIIACDFWILRTSYLS